MGPRVLVLGLALLSPLWALAARAQVPGLELRWQAPERCPDREAAERMITSALGESASAAASGEPLEVSVTIERQAPPATGFEATLSVASADQKGERRFAGSDCARVVDAAALIIAMALDPLGVSTRVSAPQPSAARPARQREALRASVGLRVTGDVGALPGPTLGVGVTLGARYARLALELDGSYFLPRLALGVPTKDSGGEIRLITGTLRGCYELLDVAGPALRFGPCAGVELGRSEGRGINLAQSDRSAGLWGAALAGLALRQAPPRGLGTAFLVEAGVPFRRPSYFVDDFGLAFQASPVVVRAALAALWLF